ncbi:MAG: 16S rRNA (uracil(1498)-N(3))-methyltransferase [Candidatus Eremiobacteraeota bacterium]|nr:16S rRNA (uracil(1498)-N(3))-methyltransferase [Candidatus Eremiobacteraeota bacterium]
MGDIVELAADDARKLVVVLRRTAGSALEVVDSSGRSYGAVLLPGNGGARARLEREGPAPRGPRLTLTLAQGIPKGQKMDFVVEKATELGVSRIVPFSSERTVGDATREGKVERWRRIAKSAAQQSGRNDVTEIASPIDFATLLAGVSAYGRTLVPWELADAAPLRDMLPPLLEGIGTLLVAIGPEGGFSAAEAAAAVDAGAKLISLGSRILRTETAGLVACSAVFYASGDM